MKKITLLTFLLVFTASIGLTAQTILTIDNNDISKKEFVDIYKKNNKELEHSHQELDDYMDLFINYKLKVMEAEKLKLDTVPSFVKELKGYRNQLAAPYLIDKDKTGDLVDEAYERMKTEVRASHILIGFNNKLGLSDTLIAYNKIMDIRKKILSGEKTFEEMAEAFSTDPSAKSNKGDLGYFKSLQMVYPFESAAYHTAVGEISMPVRTRFGYHIIKVTDKRPSQGEVKVAHILIFSNDKTPEKEKNMAKERINELYKQLQNGEDFEKLAIKFSDDKTSSKKGGELPQFGSGKMVEEFEKVAFSLKKDGEFSEPFKSSYGWHIIKRLERIPVPSKEEMLKDLQDRISKDSRAEITRKSFLNKLKKEYKFKEKKKSLAAIYSVVDSNIFAGLWKMSDYPVTNAMNKELFRIAKKRITQKEFLKYLQGSQGRSNMKDLKAYVDKRYQSFVKIELLKYEKNRLEDKYPKFKSLMKEYRDGILLFNLTEDKIWSKAAKDTVGLKNYYENHREEFKYDTRVQATIYECKDEEKANMVKAKVEEGMSSKELNDLFNKDSKLNVIIKSGLFEKRDKEILKEITFEVGTSDVKKLNGQYVLVKITEVLPDGIRTFEDSKGLVTAGYQKYLEEEWIKELRAGHTIKVNKDVLYSVK